KARRTGEVDGRRVWYEASRRDGHAERRAPDQFAGERTILPQRIQSDEFRAHLEERRICLSRTGAHQRSGAVRSSDGFLARAEHPKERRIRKSNRRKRGFLYSSQFPQNPR